jgi:hypothetical protein
MLPLPTRRASHFCACLRAAASPTASAQRSRTTEGRLLKFDGASKQAHRRLVRLAIKLQGKPLKTKHGAIDCHRRLDHVAPRYNGSGGSNLQPEPFRRPWARQHREVWVREDQTMKSPLRGQRITSGCSGATRSERP